MIADPVENKWEGAQGRASSYPTSSLAQTNTETIKVGSCPRVWLLGQLYWAISYSLGPSFECSLESYSADFVIFPICFLCSSIFSIPQECLFILTIPCTLQTAKGMVFLIIYVSSFLNPHCCWHPLSNNLLSLAIFYLKVAVQCPGDMGSALSVNVSC